MNNYHHPLVPILTNIDSQSCPKQCNFHTHTNCSDGSLSPVALANQAINLGIKHLSITDHHTIKAYHQIRPYLKKIENNGGPLPTLWTGVEISALLAGCLVHILALGFEIRDNKLSKYLGGESSSGDDLRAENVVKSIHDSGGLAILAHPARYRIGFDTLLTKASELNFDGAETWYDYDSRPVWSPTPLVCSSIQRMVTKLNLLSTCGTDTHGNSLLGR